jgi:hypothetical protein
MARRSSPRVAISFKSITLNTQLNQLPPLRIVGKYMSSNSSSAACGQLNKPELGTRVQIELRFGLNLRPEIQVCTLTFVHPR